MNSFLESNQLMVDAKEELTGVMMHSAVETELRKQNLIEYIPQSDQGLPIPHFNGKRVIVDDSMPYDTSTGVATIYIFGNGAIALGNGSHPRIIPTEIDRNARPFSSKEVLLNRKVVDLKPRVVDWQEGGDADEYPTCAEIAVGARWNRV